MFERIEEAREISLAVNRMQKETVILVKRVEFKALLLPPPNDDIRQF
jgi:hypothetical protein